MGASAPKSRRELEEELKGKTQEEKDAQIASWRKERIETFYAEMQDAVSEAVYAGSTSDYTLLHLVNLAVASIESGRPVFPNLLDEPILYRRFQQWVKQGLEEAKKMEKNTALEQLQA